VSDHDQHSSFIKTPQQLIVVVLAAFLIPILGIVLLVQLVTSQHHADPNALTAESVSARIQPVGKVEFGDPGKSLSSPTAAAGSAPATTSAAAGPADGKKVYDTVCTACHTAGVAGAPKLGDKAAWAPRIGQGVNALLQSVLKGKGAMPPKGGGASLSDADVKAAVEFIVSQSK
jgi:cytochrome c5